MSFDSLNVKFGKKSSGSAAKKIAEHTKTHGSNARARAAEQPGKYGVPVKIPKVMKSLLDSITDDDIDRVARAWREAMGATTKTYDIVAKKFVEQPDHNTRMKAGQLIAAYREGLPVQRQITLAGKFKDLGEMLGQLRDSPQGQQLLAELPAIDVESSVVREKRTTESSVQEMGAQSGADLPKQTAGES